MQFLIPNFFGRDYSVIPVSYTHLDTLELNPNGNDDSDSDDDDVEAVSYTHLDVYKRQIQKGIADRKRLRLRSQVADNFGRQAKIRSPFSKFKIVSESRFRIESDT